MIMLYQLLPEYVEATLALGVLYCMIDFILSMWTGRCHLPLLKCRVCRIHNHLEDK